MTNITKTTSGKVFNLATCIKDIIDTQKGLDTASVTAGVADIHTAQYLDSISPNWPNVSFKNWTDANHDKRVKQEADKNKITQKAVNLLYDFKVALATAFEESDIKEPTLKLRDRLKNIRANSKQGIAKLAAARTEAEKAKAKTNSTTTTDLEIDISTLVGFQAKLNSMIAIANAAADKAGTQAEKIAWTSYASGLTATIKAATK